jgi:hypothetical protein
MDNTMNTLTIREMFEMANLQFDDLYIKYLLKNTGHYPIMTKLSEINIDSCVPTYLIRLTKNNYLLLIIDSDFFGHYHTKDTDYSTKSFNPFNYDNKIISISLQHIKMNQVFSLDNMDKASTEFISLMMICDSNMITKNHIDEIRNYYCDCQSIYTSIILNKNYELTISSLTDNAIKNTINYILPTETINDFYFNYNGVLFNVNYSDLYVEFDEMNVLFNNCMKLEHQFNFEKPETLEEMELFVNKINEIPFFKLKLIE